MAQGLKLRQDRVRVWHDVKVSPRIYFRWATPADADQEYLDWLHDKEAQRWLSFPSRTLADLRRYIRAQVNNRRVVMFMIHLRVSRKLRPSADPRLGTIKLCFEGDGVASVGLMIGRYRGEGFGAEAIRLACAFARFKGGIRKVTCGIHAGNEASVKAFERAGFSITPKILGGAIVL